ncbi:MAG: tetratricopeptide repeat protein [Gammaproteobacteria bacterium]|jgi:tetratricopeptide (TPR) repeat protein|nr:tetratricopeptide repeat protein [Gammaproteobacteria bacterium]
MIKTKLAKLLLTSGFVTLFTACANTLTEPESVIEDALPETGNSAVDTNQPAESASEPAILAPAQEEIVYGNFSEDILTRVIVAEMAGQRGYNQTALTEYLALAHETKDLGIIRRATLIAAFLRDNETSIELNELWLEQELNSEEALKTSAYQLISVNRLSEALALFARMHELDYEVDYRLISNRADNNIDVQAILSSLIAEFEALLPAYPQHYNLQLAMAQLYRQNDQLQEAYEILNRLALENDDPVDILIAEIEILEEMGETRLARRRLENSLADKPDNKQLRFAYGRKLVEEDNYSDAMEQFEIIVNQDPQDFEMLYSLALISVEANQLGAARDYFQRLIVNGQRLDDAHYYLAMISDEENDPEQAIEHYLQVSGGNNYLISLRNYTELMIEHDRYSEASEYLRQLRLRRPEINSPLLALEGSLLLGAEDYYSAFTFLSRAISNNPNDTQLIQLRTIVSQELDDFALLELDLRSLMRLEPNNPSPFNTLGYYLTDQTNRFNEAKDLIDRAVEISPNDPAIIDSLGWVQFKLGMYDEAKINLERAFELFPDHEVAAHLGEVLWIMGNREAAREVWQDALETQPESEFILNTMQRLDAESDS